MIILSNHSPARLTDSHCLLDRKLHTGLCLYAQTLGAKVVALGPSLTDDDLQMDFVEVPLQEMPYRVETFDCDRGYRPRARERSRVEALVRDCSLVYGVSTTVHEIAYRNRIPYIPIVEQNLPTKMKIALMSVSNPVRRAARRVRTHFGHLQERSLLRRARAVHCNGYPAYQEVRRLNPNCLLYLDSRMSDDMVIGSEAIDARLAELKSDRRPRLVFSGRYEALKGATHVVEVGIELISRGVAFELHLYGDGSQKAELQGKVQEKDAQNQIFVHDPVPYPELVEISKKSDVFVCCHIQDDPSCSYVEALGAGLTVVGYENLMWRELQRDSQAGVVTPLGEPKACAQAIADLLSDHEALQEYSQNARGFARAHSFKQEFAKRVAGIESLCQ